MCPAQSHSNLTYTNTGGISEYLLSAPLVRRPGASRLAAQEFFSRSVVVMLFCNKLFMLFVQLARLTRWTQAPPQTAGRQDSATIISVYAGLSRPARPAPPSRRECASDAPLQAPPAEAPASSAPPAAAPRRPPDPRHRRSPRGTPGVVAQPLGGAIGAVRPPGRNDLPAHPPERARPGASVDTPPLRHAGAHRPDLPCALAPA